MAAPRSRSRTSALCTNSMAPTSRPRVGCTAMSRSGSRETSRAMMTFCWLPPESPAAAWSSQSSGRMSNSLMSPLVKSRMAL